MTLRISGFLVWIVNGVCILYRWDFVLGMHMPFVLMSVRHHMTSSEMSVWVISIPRARKVHSSVSSCKITYLRISATFIAKWSRVNDVACTYGSKIKNAAF